MPAPSHPSSARSETGRIAAVRAWVAAREPGEPVEARDRVAMLDALATIDSITGPGTHVTASGITAGERGVVLHRHRNLDRWMPPGGHVDPGELPPQSAVRETLEETGIAAAHPGGRPVLVHLAVFASAAGHTHLDLRYLLTAGPDDPTPPPEESPDVGWYPWDAALAMVDDRVGNALRSALVHLGSADNA